MPAPPLIKLGSQGPAVELLQRKLGLPLQRFGYFDQYTHDRVVAFQRSRGLYQDGKVGPQTWAALGVTDVPSGSGLTINLPGNISQWPSATGGGGGGGSNYPSGASPQAHAPAYFNWSGPATLRLLTDGWSPAAARFKNLLAQRGFSNLNVSWELSGGVNLTFAGTFPLPTPGYSLTASGMAPAGANANMVADAAEAAGFSIDRASMSGEFGSGGGGGGDPRDQGKNDWLVYVLLGVAGIVVVRQMLD